jgi:hypothetical protein
MTNRYEDDDDVRRLHEAEAELREVRQRGRNMTPLLDRLRRHASENAFAERFITAIEQNVRRKA